jgi:hypothetical protein
MLPVVVACPLFSIHRHVLQWVIALHGMLRASLLSNHRAIGRKHAGRGFAVLRLVVGRE